MANYTDNLWYDTRYMRENCFDLVDSWEDRERDLAIRKRFEGGVVIPNLLQEILPNFFNGELGSYFGFRLVVEEDKVGWLK